MDGKPLVSGDQVFDVAFGEGTISTIKAARFTVRFSTGTLSIYDSDGRSMAFGRRTLFWSDPLAGVVPPNPNAGIRLARTQAHAALDASLDSVMEAAWHR